MADAFGTPTKMAQPFSSVTAPHGRGSPAKYPERLVDHTRISSFARIGTWVDNGARVSEDLVAQVWEKALKLRTLFQDRATQLQYEGQVGFIYIVGKDEPENHPKSCLPVTALHNITKPNNFPHAVFHLSTALLLNCRSGLSFPEAGTDSDSLEAVELYPNSEMSIPWKHGIDIAWGDTPFRSCADDPASLEIVRNSFEMVRDTFNLKKGQTVGIAVYSDTGATPDTVRNKNISQQELDKIYGPAGKTHIYTGAITFVGEHHIEYDLNSFEGCSGAIVFLLNLEAQPADSGVLSADVGKAVAVHAGAHPRKFENLGFKLVAKAPKSEFTMYAAP
jgi:hypothetical protein